MRKIKNLPIMTGDFGTSTSVIYRMRRQKKRNSNDDNSTRQGEEQTTQFLCSQKD